MEWLLSLKYGEVTAKLELSAIHVIYVFRHKERFIEEALMQGFQMPQSRPEKKMKSLTVPHLLSWKRKRMI